VRASPPDAGPPPAPPPPPPRRRRAGRAAAAPLSALQRAERALNASESQLAAVIDATLDAIVTVDREGRVVLFNHGASRMFGCARAQALGASLERWLPQALQFVRRADTRPEPAAGVLVRQLALEARREDGTPFPAEASVARIALDAGPLYSLTVRDLSVALAAEQEREALERQLRQSQKMEALGTLAGGIAHDFNNIVAAILGNARLAQDALPQDARAQRFVAEIAGAGQRARELVRRILSFARQQPGELVGQPLQPLVREAVQLLRAMLPSGIALVHEEDAEPAWVLADATQVSQVLVNLGTNAWQAIGARPGRITIAVGRDAGQACVTVTDDGCGMDAATVERIFEPFFTTKPKGEGTGLGLPVVHGIVRNHGGRIAVDSRPGEGSVFRVWLPLAPAPTAAADALPAHPAVPAPPAAPVPPAALEGAGRHVVYLDDYPAMVLMVQALLQARGYRVTGFQDPHEALAWLRAQPQPPDLLVSDHNMPGCSGLELAGRLRRVHPRLPVILASGYVTEALRSEAAALGVRHVFDKPRGAEELVELVGRTLEETTDA
jgi:PAS domain S-box-containing protein